MAENRNYKADNEWKVADSEDLNRHLSSSEKIAQTDAAEPSIK